MNYLASPPLVVAYALAGTHGHRLDTDPLGTGSDGKPVYLRDIWPTSSRSRRAIEPRVTSEMFRKRYATSSTATRTGRKLSFPTGDTYQWEPDSTYVRTRPTSTACRPRARARHRHRRRARAGGARRQRHHRPHLAGRLHQGQRPRRKST
jgi:aconitase A